MLSKSTAFSETWASFVIKHRFWVVAAWIVAAAMCLIFAPRFSEVALDGDFDYLPPGMSSVVGGRLLDDAFVGVRSRSQIVFVLGKRSRLESDSKLTRGDSIVSLDFLRRLHHRLAEVNIRRANRLGMPEKIDGEISDYQREAWYGPMEIAVDSLDRAIMVDEKLYDALGDNVADFKEQGLYEPRMAIAYWDRGKARERIGAKPESVEQDFEVALILNPELPTQVLPIDERPLEAFDPWLDAMDWSDSLIGSNLTTTGARLAIIQSESELASTGNIAAFEAAKQMVSDVMDFTGRFGEAGLELRVSGSAAIGGETLLAAKEAIRYTELITVAMILAILAIVYRAPLLVLVPLISIAIAAVMAMGVISGLTMLTTNDASWLTRTIPDIRVFTTSRIFIVVVLFGAGTDFCLFYISRLREQWQTTKEEGSADESKTQHDPTWMNANRQSLASVFYALVGSGMTTIVGLAMLGIADFGKFNTTGPVIAIGLFIGLLVCISFTPALLTFIGPVAFWPGKNRISGNATDQAISNDPKANPIWSAIALQLTRYPKTLLVAGLAILCIPAAYGFRHGDAVTYDLASGLSASAESRRGLDLLQDHFDIGDITPTTALLVLPQPVETSRMEQILTDLRAGLLTVEGIENVRTGIDPLGSFKPNARQSLFSSKTWKRKIMRDHRIVRDYYYASEPEYQDRLLRLDIVVDADPFSTKAASIVENISAHLESRQSEIQPTSFSNSLPSIPELADAQVHLVGTTPSIMDLRQVTMSDTRRIRIAVVAAVFIVLVLIIRRVALSTFLILSVLITYFATLGITVAVFQWVDGSAFRGLDWKLPLFLFVILVAVGQDYNVYLVTRIMEEQNRLGWRSALRRAVSRTGGIITACGLVMAATFFSMTAAVWFPPLLSFVGVTSHSDVPLLRGIVELGFALGLGVLIDTFYVRTILVPSFVAVTGGAKN
ncbi:MAG: MMPL family transporter [Planctomycetota bacterium]